MKFLKKIKDFIANKHFEKEEKEILIIQKTKDITFEFFIFFLRYTIN